MALKVASPHRSEWNSVLFTQTFPRASSGYTYMGINMQFPVLAFFHFNLFRLSFRSSSSIFITMNRFPRPRPPRPPVRSLNLRGNEVDFPALRVVNNADLMRVVIGCHGPFVARVRDEPIPADPPLPPILAYPLLGYPPDRHYLVHTEELQLLANWMALHAVGPPVNEDEPPALNDGLPPAPIGDLPPAPIGDLPPAPIGDLPPAPIGWLVAFTINAVGNAAFATLVAAANAASATLVAASNTASATLVAASNTASATLVAASNTASATLVAAANAASATLVAAANAGSATLVAAANAASATLVAAAIVASATLIAAANAASATLIAAASIITTAQTIPVWLVALVIGLSLALSISDEAYVNFFLDILRGALLSYGYDHIHRFRPSSRSIPRGALSGWVSMAFMYVRGFILEFGNSIAQRLPEFVTTRINTELTAFLIRFLLSISCTSSFVILVFRLLSR